MHKRPIGMLSGVLTFFIALGLIEVAWAADESVPLIVDRRPVACIALGENPSWQERFAAEELQSYLKQMTSAAVPIVNTQSAEAGKGAIVFIGRPETNRSVAELIESRKIDYAPDKLTAEGFIIRTTTWKNRPCVVIAGGGDQGTIYAAYDFLERFGRVGFFRYEEHVPQRDGLLIPYCDIQERPYFTTRMHGGQYHYFGINFFGEAQWKENLAWYAKYRLNRTNYIPGPPLGEEAMSGIWRRLGLQATGASSSPVSSLSKNLSKHALNLGIRAPYVTTDGAIPPALVQAFQEKFPDTRYLKVEGSGTYIHPDDPMWLKVNQAYIESYVDQFGDGRVFYLPSPYTERSPGETREEQEEITAAYAAAVGRLAAWAETEYPGAEWVWDGWAFANKAYWEPHRVKRLFDALPPNLNMILWDYPAEDEPTYVVQSYWHGKPWAFVVCNSMAGNATVHGDINRISGNMFRVLCDQRADKNLRGFGYYTEANDYIPFFKDYVLHLAWNPIRNVDDFVADYCQRRYSTESVEAMVKCHQKLLKTVYGPESDTHLTDGFRTVRLQDPVYWFAIGGSWVPFDDLQYRTMKLRQHWSPILAQALADAFSVYEQERDNAAYRRDLVDIMRSYIHVEMNEAIWDAAQASRQGDDKAFDVHHRRVENLFEHLLAAIGLVADRWEFGVDALVKEFANAPIGRSPSEIRHHLYYVTFSGDRIYDYFRSDRYEMIRDVYRPLTMATLDGLRDRMGKGPEIKVQAAGAYDTIMDVVAENAHVASSSSQTSIIEKFIDGPCAPPPPVSDPAVVVKKFIEAINAGEI